MAIRLFDKESGAQLGDIAHEDMQLLIDQLEEEHSRDRDYFIDTATIDILEHAGASARLLALLREIVGSTEGVDIRWEEV
jgi:hypothetical protein